MKNNNLTSKSSNDVLKAETYEGLLNKVGQYRTTSDPIQVLKSYDSELDHSKDLNLVDQKSNTYKALTLHEFDKGILMTAAIPERYHSFTIDLLRKLHEEYKCVTTSEKSLVENIVINFIRTIEVEKKINSYLELGTISQIGVNYLNVMSKELDRANRHYLTSLQTLKSIKQPNFNVSIKTQTAVVGQNQIVQSNSHDKVI